MTVKSQKLNFALGNHGSESRLLARDSGCYLRRVHPTRRVGVGCQRIMPFAREFHNPSPDLG